ETFLCVYWILQQGDPEIPVSEMVYKAATEKWRETLPKPPRRPRWFRSKRQSQPEFLTNPPVIPEKAETAQILLLLPPEHRIAVALHFIEGFDYQAIGRITGDAGKSIAETIFEAKTLFVNKLKNNETPCLGMEPLLSGYADRELGHGDKSRVENHTRICPKCRNRLEEYTKLRERLAALWRTTAIPDNREEILTALREMPAPILPQPVKVKRRRLHPGYAFAAAFLLALPLLLNSDKVMPVNLILSRTQAATADVNTFVDTSMDPQISYGYIFEYAGKTAHHMKTTGSPASNYEIIVIGDDVYITAPTIVSSDTSFLSQDQANYYQNLFPRYLTVLKRENDAIIEGYDCYHLTWDFDMVKYLADVRARYQEKYPDSLVNSMVNGFVGQQIKWEAWISKSDNLIRQTRQTRSSKYGPLYTNTSTYSRLNEPISILPPLSSSGELLPGWGHYQKQSGVFVQVSP
ncbi:MAG: zf-HC2 domain-containing protein, partial [Dehalococcoidales bacterium]|nr:zf-HC2 domain-containing protein [Dehalococcoidales bacterium]